MFRNLMLAVHKYLQNSSELRLKTLTGKRDNLLGLVQLSYQFADFCSNLDMLWNGSYELRYLAFNFLISGICLCLAMLVQHCTFNHWLFLLNLRMKSIGWNLKWTYSNFSSWLILVAIRLNLEFIYFGPI